MKNRSQEVKKVIDYIDSHYQQAYVQTYSQGQLSQNQIESWARSLVAPAMTFADLRTKPKNRQQGKDTPRYSEKWINLPPLELLSLLKSGETNTPELTVSKIEQLTKRDQFRLLSLVGLVFGLQRFPSVAAHPTPLEKMGLKIVEEKNAEVFCMYGVIDPIKSHLHKMPLHTRQPETVILGSLVVTPYTGSLQFAPHDNRSIYQISRVGIFSNFKNQGLGEKLVKLVLEKYNSANSIFVLSAREGRENFYKRCGFVEHGEPYLNNGLSNQWMIKK